MNNSSSRVLSSLVHFEHASTKLVSVFFTEVEVALFFRRKVEKKLVFDKTALSVSVFPTSSNTVENKVENINGKASQLFLAESVSIAFFYLHSFPSSNYERNKIEIQLPGRKGKKGKTWKFFTGCDSDMTRWEQKIRSSRSLAKKCKSFKVTATGTVVESFDEGLISARTSAVYGISSTTSTQGEKKSVSFDSALPVIVEVRLPDDAGIVKIEIKKRDNKIKLSELKSKLWAKIVALDENSAYANDRHYIVTNVINPLLNIDLEDEIPGTSGPFHTILSCGEDAYLFKLEPDADLKFQVDEKLWMFDEDVDLRAVYDSKIQSASSSTFIMHLCHINKLPHGGLNCVVKEINTVDVFQKQCVRHHIRVWHGPIVWSIEYSSNHFYRLEKLLKKQYSTLSVDIRRAQAPLPTLGMAIISKDVFQNYVFSLLRHPWASGSVQLLEFLGAINSSRNNDMDRNVIHVSRLTQYVDVGDLILFKCSDVKSGLTRMAIKSEWDHVGVVVRDSLFGGFKILESTGEGVNSYPLVGRLRGYYLAGFVDYIGIRRLGPGFRVKRSRNDDIDVQGIKFVKTVKGKPYSFGLSSYFFSGNREADSSADAVQKSGNGENTASSDKIFEAEKKKGYFCSELVVAYLQCIGAVKQYHSSLHSLPNIFEDNGDIEKNLADGVFLDKTVLLDCRILELASAKVKVGEGDDDVSC